MLRRSAIAVALIVKEMVGFAGQEDTPLSSTCVGRNNHTIPDVVERIPDVLDHGRLGVKLSMSVRSRKQIGSLTLRKEKKEECDQC